MSSGQWEVVGKNKKSQNGKVKNNKEEDKKTLKNGPKLEDIVPHSQSYYAGMEVDDNKKAAKDKKKDGDKKGKKSDKTSKPKPPKTIEEALEAIDPAELSTIITTNKLRFSNAPLVWLKEVANYLNSKIQIEVDDPTFSSYSSQYPTCVIPDPIKESLEKILQDAGKANAQLFFDVTLTALANDISRGQHVNGHRVLLQLLALSNPEFCIASIQKNVSLRNSYQNRPPIGLSLLWAIGQGGLRDFAVGLKAWQEVFLPIIELKNYSKYVISYLSTLMDNQAALKATVTQDQLFAMFDLVNSKRTALSKDLSNDLVLQLSKYKDIYFEKSGNKLQVAFNQLMKKLPNQYLSGPLLDPYNKVIVETLLNCMYKDDSCNATWRQLFHKCTKQSATVIEYIDKNWEEVTPRLKLKSLKTTITQFKEVGVEALKGKKKDETVVKANKICQDILDRMTSTRRFPWFWASFFLLVGIAGLVAYDVSNAGGNFPKSTTGRLFKDLGILEHSQYAWKKTLSSSARGYIWVENNVPIYIGNTIEFAKPYTQLTKDAFVVAVKRAGVIYANMKEYLTEKSPVVLATIEQYAPGLVENVQVYSANGFNAVKQYSSNYYQLTADYLRTKVFVGDWSPEILQNKTETALNATRLHMTTYFHWFREQVHLYSKIP